MLRATMTGQNPSFLDPSRLEEDKESRSGMGAMHLLEALDLTERNASSINAQANKTG